MNALRRITDSFILWVGMSSKLKRELAESRSEVKRLTGHAARYREQLSVVERALGDARRETVHVGNERLKLVEDNAQLRHALRQAATLIGKRTRPDFIDDALNP